MYIKALLAVKRRIGVAKAPVLGHFSAVTAGIGLRGSPPSVSIISDFGFAQ
jgi:hypothetical protein